MKISALLEVFNQIYPYNKISGDTEEEWSYKFETANGDPVFVQMYRDEQSDNKDQWEILFDRDGKMFRTGEGDAFKIFGTVLEIIRDFIKQKKPSKIFFESDKIEVSPYYDQEETNLSRERLYDRMVDKFAGSMGYNISKRDTTATRIYTLDKKNV